MATRTIAGVEIQINDEGFLTDPGAWSKEIAVELASEEGINVLTENHWKVIDFLRQYYLEWESAPPIRMLSRKTGLSLRELRQLFPDGLAKCACRYAGLPRRVLNRYM